MDFRNIWADNASDTLSITSELTTSSLSLFSSNYHHYQYNNDDFNNFEINSFGRTTTPTTTESALSSSPPLTELNSDTQSLCSNSNRYDGDGRPSTSTSTSTAPTTSDRRQKIYCETVSVANSGHVAQIVGKNGCKIKHLRAKYGTYIHTPAANEEPVFIIRGPKDKVMAVKQEIIRADNHFAEIKQARNVKIMQKIDSNDAASIRLFIPDKYIGLVVGRNGWFVKDLQSTYNIYIETPKFDLCNYFQLYGSRVHCDMVIHSIYDCLCTKTGINFSKKIDSNDIYFDE